MKILLAVILLSCAALPQDEAAIAKTKTACGPDNIWFDAKVSDETPPPASPAPGKANQACREDRQSRQKC